MSIVKSIKGQKSDYCNLANTRLMTRILIVLEDINKHINISKFGEYIVGDNGSRTKDAIHWLVNHNLILKTKENSGVLLYSINPLWKELKNE